MEILAMGLGFGLVNYLCQQYKEENKKDKLIFIGTGTSAGVPLVSCLTNKETKCPTCFDAIKPNSKNKRGNTSILLQKEVNGVYKNLLIDCGKFFFHSAIDIFPKYNINKIDSVLLTHEHLGFFTIILTCYKDATGGLDDLRDLIKKGESIKIYLREKDLRTLEKTHFYLVDASKATGSGNLSNYLIPQGVVAQLQFEVFQPETKFTINDIEIEQFEVFHGPRYMCSAFKFYNIAYISDVSEIPEKVRPHLENLDLLIIDCLARFLLKEALVANKNYALSHFLLHQSIDEVRKLKPKKALFVGMCHRLDHEEVNRELASLRRTEGLDIELAYDSMCVNVNLQ